MLQDHHKAAISAARAMINAVLQRSCVVGGAVADSRPRGGVAARLWDVVFWGLKVWVLAEK